MYYRIIGEKLIQVSDSFISGYKEMIEDERPEEREGYYIAYNYVIVNDEVHKEYHYEEIVEPVEEEAIEDNEDIAEEQVEEN